MRVPRGLLASAAALGLLTPVMLAAPAAAASQLPYCVFNVDTHVLTCSPTEPGLLSRQQASAALTVTYLLARLYDDANRVGPYYELVGATPCDTSPDVDFEVSNVGSTWNDRVSSFQGFSECQVRVYENASFGGASYGAFTSTDYVGDPMNDRTTSLRLH